MGHYAYFKDIMAEENERDDTIHKVKTLGDISSIKDNICPRCGEHLVEKDSKGFSGETFKVLKCVKPGCGFCK